PRSGRSRRTCCCSSPSAGSECTSRGCRGGRGAEQAIEEHTDPVIGGAAARVGPWSAAAVTIALSLAAAGVAGTGPGSAGLQGVGLKLLVMPVLWAVPGALIAAHGTAVGIVSPAGGVLAHRDTDLLPADE